MLMTVALPRRALGDLNSTANDLLAGSSASPFVYIGGALLVWYLFSRTSNAVRGLSSSPRPRRRVKRIPAFTTAVYAAGAAAGGYLVGKYTGL